MSQDRVVITKADKHTAVWEKLQDHWGQRLEELRVKNDADQDERSTAMIRGEIKQIKSFLAMDKDAPDVPKQFHDQF